MSQAHSVLPAGKLVSMCIIMGLTRWGVITFYFVYESQTALCSLENIPSHIDHLQTASISNSIAPVNTQFFLPRANRGYNWWQSREVTPQADLNGRRSAISIWFLFKWCIHLSHLERFTILFCFLITVLKELVTLKEKLCVILNLLNFL